MWCVGGWGVFGAARGTELLQGWPGSRLRYSLAGSDARPSPERPGLELAESSWITTTGGAAYRSSSRYRAICRAASRGRARPYRPPKLLGSC